MDERRIGYCRDLARAVVKKHGVREPPVDVQAIARAEGFEIEEADLGTVDGRARRLEGDWLIEVNATRTRTNQQFTVAHEMGHIKLGHESCAGEPVNERQANVFAAELLMPLAMLNKALKTTRALGALAELFAVSKDAMRIKLEEQRLFMKLQSFD